MDQQKQNMCTGTALGLARPAVANDYHPPQPLDTFLSRPSQSWETRFVAASSRHFGSRAERFRRCLRGAILWPRLFTGERAAALGSVTRRAASR